MGLDLDIFRAINQAGSNAFLDAVFLAFTFLGFTFVIIWAPIIAWLMNRKEPAIDMALALFVSSIAVHVMKSMIDRDRPFEVLDDVNLLSYGWISSASDPSFPSGHAAKAFAVASVAALNARRSYALAGVVIAVMVGLSRIYLGLHWPSDVLGGAIVGIAAGLAFYVLGRRSCVYRDFRVRIMGWSVAVRERFRKPELQALMLPPAETSMRDTDNRGQLPKEPAI